MRAKDQGLLRHVYCTAAWLQKRVGQEDQGIYAKLSGSNMKSESIIVHLSPAKHSMVT